MKGIILAGGAGTRLHPLTISVSKQLMPVYDKPMIYYPLSTLMLSGIREVLIITPPEDQAGFIKLMGDGSQLGMHFEYKVQEVPNGLAQAFVIGADFVGSDSVCLILGDNIFYGSDLANRLQKCTNPDGAIITAYPVNDPERYGVVEFDTNKRAISIEEKPKHPKSHFAVPGLYYYDNSVIKIAHEIKPSARGEYEITDVNRVYLEQGKLRVMEIGRGTAWLDTGTFESLMQASQFVEVMQSRQGLKISCIEEIAYRKGFIDKDQLCKLAEPIRKSGYGEYLLKLVNEQA
ncbi:MAG: glucose-1-phosphate thymidylyltransferase RfbA [Candidatus Cloacimonetes bacterium]|nr:glucose-1-phosphate thymidylyltransferase RfbA [Candidatus Cloacimonadota bacterium]